MKISRSKTLDLPVTLPYKQEPHDDIGDLFTMKEFKEMSKDASLIDYDGHGYYATETAQTDIVIRPSHTYDSMMECCKIEYEAHKHLTKHFTHVKWYNR